MIHKHNFDMVQMYETLCNSHVEIASDPVLLSCTLSIPVTYQPKSKNVTLSSWQKATPEMLYAYQVDINTYFQELSEVMPSNAADIDIYLDTITEVSLKAAVLNIPMSKFCPFIKPYWTPDVKQAHTLARSNARSGLKLVGHEVWLMNRTRNIRDQKYFPDLCSSL